MSVNIDFPKTYKKFFESRSRYQLLYGSAGSGKSYSAAIKLILLTLGREYSKILVVRSVFATIKDSVFSDLKSIIYDYDLESLFSITETPMKITCKHNNNSIIFRGLDDVNKIKSVSKISTIFIEEATEEGISKEDIEQLDLRLRGDFVNSFQMIFAFNPTNPNSPLRVMYPLLDLTDKRAGFGYQRDNCFALRTTFEHNPFVGDEYKKKMRELQSRNDTFSKIYAEGLWAATDDPDSLIQLSFLDKCIGKTLITEKDSEIKFYCGIDVARFGNDASCFVIIDSLGQIREIKYLKKHSIDMVSQKALEIIKKWNVKIVGVDVIGLGAGVADILRTYSEFDTIDVNSASNPKESFSDSFYEFYNLRTQLAFILKNNIESQRISLPELTDIEKREITSIRYEIKAGKKIALLPKDKIKKTLGKSPDFSDALQIALGLKEEILTPETNLISIF